MGTVYPRCVFAIAHIDGSAAIFLAVEV